MLRAVEAEVEFVDAAERKNPEGQLGPAIQLPARASCDGAEQVVQ